MENCNQTSNDFILLGLFPPSSAGFLLIALIILVFLMALIGNLSMMLLILLDPHLHTPMYFPLSQLSLIDLNYNSTIIPKMASYFLFGSKSISLMGYGIQSFFFLTLGGAETLLLTSMAYDRYVAICRPLHCPACPVLALGTELTLDREKYASAMTQAVARTSPSLPTPFPGSDHVYPICGGCPHSTPVWSASHPVPPRCAVVP
ncbi:olfactory receptor 2L5-like [Tupaia chinensis]|uniref:olfactory receptor 2L5-like n=1 Tax=Tupaia chinensis TaxID=246437 RepID=UPI0003C918EC|nr:olfactory receptor 2L5-like [Tupaia chinensis]